MRTRLIKSSQLSIAFAVILVLLIAPVNTSHTVSATQPATLWVDLLQIDTNPHPPSNTDDCVPLTGADYDWSPLNPNAGDEVSFYVISTTPSNATTPITYTWDFDDGYGDLGDVVPHTFSTGGSYWVYLTATNACSEVYMSHGVTVSGSSEPIISVSPTYGFTILCYVRDILTDTLSIRNVYSATADLNWTLMEDPPASWLDLSLTSGSLAPGQEDLVILTYDATGLNAGDHFSTTLRIESNDPDDSPWTKAIAEIYIMEGGLESVDLTVTDPGPYYTIEPIQFSADLSPNNADKPYTYTIEFGPDLFGPHQSSDDPFLLAMSTILTGTQTLTFTAWNTSYQARVSDSVTITIYDQDKTIYLPMILSGSK